MDNKVKIPSSLKQKIHSNHVSNNYKAGVFIFKAIDDTSVQIVLDSLLEYCLENDLMDEVGKMNMKELFGIE